ncbi:catalase family protein [Coralloluteibacterium stylophorae]|uniref:Catalase family protein n=1 Tax=Coralloluteibacterium stylophorae TaxID=1776034 RepID=A0A8J8AZ67_9GAMM|nr:catalase family protein [Coralloluteibacterium stylophorae]MBS7455747.1 catalase family protein [Coralloluteibacterium stylophorae]
MSPRPLLFDPALEAVPDDEAETTAELVAGFREIIETTWSDYGHAVRSVHAKSHGLLEGRLRVRDDLPPEYAQGVFARPRDYPVVLRFSTNPGDILDDNVSTPRGLALKLVGVDGERLPGSADASTQDFVMINAPAFSAATPKAFLKNLKLLARTTDRAPRSKRALSAVLRGVERAVEAVGGESAALKSLGGHPETHILGETFYTAVPILYGPYYAKLSVAPVAPALTALTDAPLDLKGRPDGIREAVRAYFAEQGGAWEVRVQLATDPETMPIEDASAVWPEDASPYVTVARIEVPAQDAWNPERAARIDDGMAFSPWHGIAAHRPLGGVMRSRRPAYEMSAGFRAEHNGCPIREPRVAPPQG